MAKRLDESLGTVGYDNLFVENVPEADVVAVKLAASQGVLARGTVISGTPGGEDFAALSAVADATKALYVLSDDVDTGTDGAVVGIAYRTGHFNRAAMAVKSSYTLTAADEEILRGKGILVSDALEY